jgi:hypothetical protein
MPAVFVLGSGTFVIVKVVKNVFGSTDEGRLQTKSPPGPLVRTPPPPKTKMDENKAERIGKALCQT